MYADGCELLVLTALLPSVSLPINKFFDRLNAVSNGHGISVDLCNRMLCNVSF